MKERFLIIFLSIFIFSFPQETKQFSELSYSDIEKLLQEYYAKNEIAEVKKVSRYYLNKAKRENNITKIAEGYVLVGFSEEFPTCLTYIDSLKMISSKLSNQDAYPARIYLLKGKLYDRNNKRAEALQNYLDGLEYAKQKNNKKQIEFAEIRIAYLNNYIGNHQKAVKSLRNIVYNSKYITGTEKQEVHLNLADIYLDLNELDSAKTLILKGLELNSNNRKSRFYNAYLSSYGLYHLKSKNYSAAIDNFNNCIDFFFKGKDKREISYTLMHLGESYVGIGNKNKAIKEFTKLDSLVKKDNYIFPELKNVYSYLIDYYKEKKDSERHLYYVERLLDINERLDSEFRYISRELPKQYDTVQLLEQKESILKELKKRKFTSILSVSLLSLIILLSAILYYKTKKQEKKHKKRAQELLISLENLKNKGNIIPPVIIEENSNIHKKVTKAIPEKIYSLIIGELENFEHQRLFLEKGITLASMAKSFNTNSSYLSDVINNYKNKSFANYINDLRIDYAVQQLAEDKKLRSYKVSGIAEELGYNNEQAFSIAFKKKTGTTVSSYIKEIDAKIIEVLNTL